MSRTAGRSTSVVAGIAGVAGPDATDGRRRILQLKREAVVNGWIESQDWSELVWVGAWLAALIVFGIALSIYGNQLKR